MAKKGSAMVASAIVAAVAGTAFIGCNAGVAQAGLLTPQHVVVVIEENHSYSQIAGNTTDAPYINNTLIGSGGLLYTGSYSPEHPSQPNYLDLFSGSDQGMTGDYFPGAPQYTEPLTTANLGAQLLNAGDSFKEYNQTYSAIDNTTSYNQATYSPANPTPNEIYARKHNPVVNWVNPNLTSVSGNQLPLSTMTGFSEFPTTAAGYANLPTVSFVIPNLENDMHNGTIQAGDSWLQQNLNGYVQWAKTNNSLLLVTWDENDYTLQDGNHIATIINGDPSLFVPGQSNQVFNSYSVLRTLEDMYGLGYAGNAATSPDLAFNSAGQLAAVPEPASLMLMLLGALAFLIPTRRNRDSARR
jgi:acid phosphatase